MKDGEDLQTNIYAQHQMCDQSILRQYHLRTEVMYHNVPFTTCDVILFMYTKNNRGPNALPCGIPPLTKPHDEKESLYFTRWRRPHK